MQPRTSPSTGSQVDFDLLGARIIPKKQKKEKRLGYLSKKELLAEVRKIFPNARVLPNEQPKKLPGQQTLMNAQPVSERDETVCRICGQPKPIHNFVCRGCFNRLPPNFRKSFVTLKLQSLWWLREHPTTTNNESKNIT